MNCDLLKLYLFFLQFIYILSFDLLNLFLFFLQFIYILSCNLPRLYLFLLYFRYPRTLTSIILWINNASIIIIPIVLGMTRIIYNWINLLFQSCSYTCTFFYLFILICYLNHQIFNACIQIGLLLFRRPFEL